MSLRGIVSKNAVCLFTIFTLSLVGLLPSISFAVSASEYGAVLNLSGKQRMLSQKLSKEIILIALGVDKQTNLDNLKGTAALFDKTLKGLRDGDADLGLPPTSSKRILKQLGKVEVLWVDYYVTVKDILDSKNVSKEQVATAAAQNVPLLTEMNKCVNLYEKDASKSGLKSDPDLAVAINLSGKQRMLSQKMSKEFLLIAYGHEFEENQLNLFETYSLFDRTLKGLLDGDETLDLPGTKNPEIRKQLVIVDGLWKSFLPQIKYGSEPSTKSIPQDKVTAIANTNLPLLTEMNKAVGMYEQEANK